MATWKFSIRKRCPVCGAEASPGQRRQSRTEQISLTCAGCGAALNWTSVSTVVILIAVIFAFVLSGIDWLNPWIRGSAFMLFWLLILVALPGFVQLKSVSAE